MLKLETSPFASSLHHSPNARSDEAVGIGFRIKKNAHQCSYFDCFLKPLLTPASSSQTSRELHLQSYEMETMAM
jgi:hypothetical protein